jgi:hypothetical protein
MPVQDLGRLGSLGLSEDFTVCSGRHRLSLLASLYA